MSIKIPWQVWACAGLCLFLVLFGWYWDHHGASRVQQRWDASVVRGTVIVAALKAGQGKVTTRIETKYVDRWKVIHEKGDTITKLIPQFISNGTCDLPGGFRVLHDAAVSGTIPTAAEASNAEPVSATDAATTITENYTTCNQAISDLTGLREWIQQQQAVYLERCKLPGVDCNKGS